MSAFPISRRCRSQSFRIAVGLVAGLLAMPSYALKVGDSAPAFSLPARDGKTVSLADLRGHYVYVDFWASWCGPCKMSFPWMNQLQAKHAASGLQVVAINVDEKSSDADKFLAEVPPTFTVVFDSKGVTPGSYNVQGMPTSFLVDPNGKVVLIHQSFKDSERAALDQKIVDTMTGAKP